MKANEEIREYAKVKNVRLWEVADKLSIPDTSFSKMLRYEIKSEKKSEILTIIDNIAAERAS